MTPHTPIHVLQQLGRVLQIPDAELIEDRLEAGPGEESSTKSSND